MTRSTLDHVADLGARRAPRSTVDYTRDLARQWADDPGSWLGQVRHVRTGRWYAPLFTSDTANGWLIAWAPGSVLDWHDHGDASGSVAVVEGALTETFIEQGVDTDQRTRELSAGSLISFGPDHVHVVRNEGEQLAVSIHVYAPRLGRMKFYAPCPGRPGLQVIGPRPWEDVAIPDATGFGAPLPDPLDLLVEQARSSLKRLDPLDAARVVERGALLVDIRPLEQRRREGEIPDAVIIDRNVLEWRLAPSSPQRIPELMSPDQDIVLFCSEGYASSLAARSLQSVGLPNATDLVGGFVAWDDADLPTAAFGQAGCVDRTAPRPGDG